MNSETTPISFSADRLKKLSLMEQWHFWFVGRRELIQMLLTRYFPSGRDKNRLADLGCGTGILHSWLLLHGYQSIGYDLRPEGLQVTRSANPHAALVNASVEAIPFTNESLNAVLLLDVLEHVDDNWTLTEINRILTPGGVMFVTVPAIPWLWSYRDQAAGHHRRYTRTTLRCTLEDAGFEIIYMRFYHFILFPLVLLTRLLGKKNSTLRDLEEKKLPGLNSALSCINRWEVGLSQWVSWPWGSSLVAVCQKLNRRIN